MKNIKFIVDLEDKRESVIISNQNFTSVQKFLKQQLVLSILDKSIKVFDISEVIDGKKVYASPLLESLAQIFYFADNYKTDKDNYEITVTDEQAAAFFGFHKKNIQKQRNDVIKPYMASERGKAVIDFVQHPASEQEGATYTLNYLKAIEGALEEYLKGNNFGIEEIISSVRDAKKFQNTEMENSNNAFKKLIETVVSRLDELPKHSFFYERVSSKGSREWQKSKPEKSEKKLLF